MVLEILPSDDNCCNETMKNLISPTDVIADYKSTISHPLNLTNDPGLKQVMTRFFLKRFLMLVLVLDRVKVQGILPGDPPLFSSSSAHKSSAALLCAFSAKVLSGEGDILKHLALLGYSVSVIQKTVDEVVWEVKNLKTDLRDGVRLAKVSGVCGGGWEGFRVSIIFF